MRNGVASAKAPEPPIDDGMEVERDLHADHQADIFFRIEELPAGGDK